MYEAHAVAAQASSLLLISSTFSVQYLCRNCNSPLGKKEGAFVNHYSTR